MPTGIWQGQGPLPPPPPLPRENQYNAGQGAANTFPSGLFMSAGVCLVYLIWESLHPGTRMKTM